MVEHSDHPAAEGAGPNLLPAAVDHMRANTELITQISQIVARAAQSMTARQTAVIAEAVTDMTTMLRAAMPNPNDPTAASRAYATYVESVMRRGVAQLNFSVASVAEMSSSALELAQQRFSSATPAATHPPVAAVHHHPKK